VTHSLAAIKALEKALDVEVPEQTNKLRLLTLYGEQLESHSLHVGYLVAPDLLGQTSVVPLVDSHPDVVTNIIAIHAVGNRVMELLAGRKTHPVRLRPGGFSRLPSVADLRRLHDDLEDTLPRLEKLADVMMSLIEGFPAFERPTEYVALVNPPTYPFYFGEIGSSDTDVPVPVDEFERVVNEYVSPQSTAKWTHWHRDSYAVGALARFNLNAPHLLPLARRTAERMGLRRGCCNPYWNNVSQVVEAVQVVERSLQLIDEVLTVGLHEESVPVTPHSGIGAAAVEAPRGTLFHRYELDNRGRCVRANLCIPTNQNHANIQKDFEALVPQVLEHGQEHTRRMMEMLVRSYDPCVSCSTHMLDVSFV
jgi:coenzyme F420-reducing hydrogenase alpha subunit